VVNRFAILVREARRSIRHRSLLHAEDEDEDEGDGEGKW
jgi:hypothetical protein